MDKELVEIVNSRDISKGDRVVNAFRPLIISSINRYYNKPNLFDELYQEGCVEVLEGILDYMPDRNVEFPGYIKRRLYYFFLGKNKGRECISLNEEYGEGGTLMDTLESGEDLEENLVNQERVKNLHRTMDRLAPRQKQVIEDYYLKGLSLKQIADKHGISYRTCYNSKTRGLDRLREMMEQ